MIEGVRGFEIFDLGIFGGRKILASIFLGFFGVFKTNVSIFCVMSFNAPWKFLWLGNSAWDFLGVKFWSREFLGFCLKPYGFFRVLIFAPIKSSLSLKFQSTPLGHWQLFNSSFWNYFPCLVLNLLSSPVFGLSVLHCWQLFCILLDRDQPVLYPFNSKLVCYLLFFGQLNKDTSKTACAKYSKS